MITSHTISGKKGSLMLKPRSIAGAVVALSLVLAPLVSLTANAATGGPRDSYITLQTPVLDASNTSEAGQNQGDADTWVAKGWFGSGLKYQVSFAPVGSTINLTYTIKDKNGKPLAYTPVNLRMNKGYSESASIIEVDGIKTKGIDRPPFDQANVIHRTDAFGNVTFAVKNLDLESLGEPEPPTFTSKPIFSDDKLDRLHSQMLPEVNSEQADHSVITQFHYYIPKAPIVVAATKPSISLVIPALDATNSVTNSAKNVKQAWAPAGGDLVVVYKVVGDDGKSAVPNKAVTLKVNGGKSTLQATTDAFGFVAFTVKNSDTKPNNAPASAITAMPAASTAFATLVPEITGTLAAVTEGVEFHYYRGITASAVKSGKEFVLSIQVNGAAGKSAAISVTGAKKSTVRISAPRQVVSMKVSAGAKTVTAVIDGKSYTTKVVVK
jgi:hypothetical protein